MRSRVVRVGLCLLVFTAAARNADIARAAVLAFTAASENGDSVTYLPASAVSQAFAKGKPLLETDGYKIHASRRDAPGMAEVHVRDTDIIYVLDGTATLVTGGDVIDGKTVAPDEVRGPAIRGGTSQRLSKGDVLVVPNGVPHWFTEVQAPFIYYVVKATAPLGGSR